MNGLMPTCSVQVCDHVAVAVDFGLRLRGKKGGGSLQALCEEVGVSVVTFELSFVLTQQPADLRQQLQWSCAHVT
jgi:hypothetical protein